MNLLVHKMFHNIELYLTNVTIIRILVREILDLEEL